jgi:hypothetical protein
MKKLGISRRADADISASADMSSRWFRQHPASPVKTDPGLNAHLVQFQPLIGLLHGWDLAGMSIADGRITAILAHRIHSGA